MVRRCIQSINFFCSIILNWDYPRPNPLKSLSKQWFSQIFKVKDFCFWYLWVVLERKKSYSIHGKMFFDISFQNFMKSLQIYESKKWVVIWIEFQWFQLAIWGLSLTAVNSKPSWVWDSSRRIECIRVWFWGWGHWRENVELILFSKFQSNQTCFEMELFSKK